MGARLILFFLFLSLLTFIFTLTDYKQYFIPEEDLSNKQMQKMVEQHKEEKKRAMMADVPKKDIKPKKVGMDLNDPMIKKGMLVYTEKGQCIQCHGEKGQGSIDEKAPLIAGQHDWYVIDQLQQMKEGKRVNQEMNPYLAKIDESDIKAVAKYIKYLRVK